MDKVFINGLKTDAVIGVYDWERDIRQTLLLDLELAWDNKCPAAEDNLLLALDYDKLTRRLIEFVSGSSYGLLETLAEDIARIINREFKVTWLKLKLHKPDAIKEASSVGVEIVRSFEQQ